MAPHSMESILQPPQWPPALSSFVTWCLMWDPKNRPTSSQALNHEYFADAVDPLRPKSSTARLLGRKHSDKSFRSSTREPTDSPTLTSKPSWFRRSLIGRSESPCPTLEGDQSAKPPVVSYNAVPEPQAAKAKPAKRNTWANGVPMAILPSIRPVSPLSNAVTAQANATLAYGGENSTTCAESGKTTKKIGRQLSLNSHGNHYADAHRQEAERALNGGGVGNSGTPQKESFFSHLRKRARRLSGRNQSTIAGDDVEANAGCMPWSNRSSMALDSVSMEHKLNPEVSELDRALQNVRYSLDTSSMGNVPVQITSPGDSSNKRQSMPMPQGSIRSMGDSPVSTSSNGTPIASRTRRAMQMSTHPVHRYETPEEEDELLDEVLHSATRAARRLEQNQTPTDDSYNGRQHMANTSRPLPSPYPTPSPSARCDGVSFGQNDATPCKRGTLMDAKGAHASIARQWPTPPYEEGEWTGAASSSYFPAGLTYR